MAEVKLLKVNATEGFPEEMDTAADTITLAGMTLSGDLNLSGGATVTGVPTPSADSDAAPKSYVDNLVDGTPWQSVQCMEVISDALSTPPGGDSEGDAYIVGASPSGDWSAFSQGDLVQYVSSSWVLVLAGSGGEPADGCKVLVTDGTAAGSFVGEENNIGVYDATGNSWSFTSAADGKAIIVHGENALYENTKWVYDASASDWVRFGGDVTAGAGLDITGNEIFVGNGDGITVNADSIELALSASNPGLQLAGTSPNKTLEVLLKSNEGIDKDASGLFIKIDDTPDTLDVDSDGLKVVGLPSLFKINDVAVGSTVTAANLDELTDGSETTLHSHAGSDESSRVENTYTNEAAVTTGRAVRFGSTNSQIVHADNTSLSGAHPIGVARTGGAIDPGTSEVVSHGPCAGCLSGATVNTPYFLGASGQLVLFGTLSAGQRMIRIGWAINATDLFVNIMDFGLKAS